MYSTFFILVLVSVTRALPRPQSTQAEKWPCWAGHSQGCEPYPTCSDNFVTTDGKFGRNEDGTECILYDICPPEVTQSGWSAVKGKLCFAHSGPFPRLTSKDTAPAAASATQPSASSKFSVRSVSSSRTVEKPTVREVSGFLTRKDQQLILNGAPFTMIGGNMYNLAGGDKSTPFSSSCKVRHNEVDYDTYLKKYFQSASETGMNVLRVMAFQSTAGANGSDFRNLDRVVKHARDAGIRLILTLENNWSDCTTPSTTKDSAWYKEGYKAPYGTYTLSFRDYVSQIVTKYKNEPTVALWEIMNEAKGYFDDGTDQPVLLMNMFRDISDLIKSIDKNHLVASGGNLECWQSGQGDVNFKTYSDLPSVDVLDYHDYTNSMFDECAKRAVQVAKDLNKPMIVGEFNTPSGVAREVRAGILGAKMRNNLEQGIQGSLVWQFGFERTDPDDQDLLVDDPALPYFSNVIV